MDDKDWVLHGGLTRLSFSELQTNPKEALQDNTTIHVNNFSENTREPVQQFHRRVEELTTIVSTLTEVVQVQGHSSTKSASSKAALLWRGMRC